MAMKKHTGSALGLMFSLCTALDGRVPAPDERIIAQMSACSAVAWWRHFPTAAFLFERGIVPAALERLSDLNRPDDLARWPGPAE
jgi:hypothetical protein